LLVLESAFLLDRRGRVIRHRDAAFGVTAFPVRSLGQKQIILAALGLEFLIMQGFHHRNMSFSELVSYTICHTIVTCWK
jgi:hypothetical protein